MRLILEKDIINQNIFKLSNQFEILKNDELIFKSDDRKLSYDVYNSLILREKQRC